MANFKHISIDGTSYDAVPARSYVTGVKGNSESTYRTGNVNITKANIGLGSVGNFKAVSTAASQGLSATEQLNARTNIDVETSHSIYNNTDFENLLFGTNYVNRLIQFHTWNTQISRLPSGVSYFSGIILPTAETGSEYRAIIGTNFSTDDMYFGHAYKSGSTITMVWKKITATLV